MRYELKDLEDFVATGKYKLTVGDQSHDLEVKGKPGKYKLTIQQEGKKKGVNVQAKFTGQLVTLRFKLGNDGFSRLSGWIEGAHWQGSGEQPNGQPVSWQAERTGDLDPEKEKPKRPDGEEDETPQDEEGQDDPPIR